MFTKLLVIQKINENGEINVFQAHTENIRWSFEKQRTQIKTDKEYFPFSIYDNVKVLKRQAGAETSIYSRGNEITFCDDYGVSGSTVIGILFPKNYIPDVIKFKDNPYIPVGLAGQVSTSPPGQIQILYNNIEKKCAIVFHIYEPILFGFKCISKKVSDDKFPRNEHTLVDDFFDITLSRKFLAVDSISTNDLKLINETLCYTDITEIQLALNDLLSAVKSGQIKQTKTLLNKAGALLLNGVSVASSLTTIADSYKTGGAAQQFIAQIIRYISL